MPSLDVRVQAKGRPQVDFAGIVDSGASQADFFAAFGIMFRRNTAPATFELSC